MCKITNVAENFLFYFLKYPQSSTYTIHQHIEANYMEQGKTINYKNVYERVKKLLENDLIAEVKQENGRRSPHGAILFELTSFGFFYLLLNKLHRNDKDIILKHKLSPFFKLFLFPYFDTDTIAKLRDPKILDLIFDYLHRCSKKLDGYLESMIDTEKEGGMYKTIGHTAPLFDETHSKRNQGGLNFLEWIKDELGVSWPISTEKAITEVIEKNIKVKLSDGTTELLLEICEKEQIAILSLNDKAMYMFQIRPDFLEDGYRIIDLYCTVEEFMDKYDFFDKGITEKDDDEESHILTKFGLTRQYPDEDAIRLGYNILEQIDFLKLEKVSYNTLEYVPDYSDIQVLSNDKKFMKLLQRVKNRFDNQYNLFMNLKQ